MDIQDIMIQLNKEKDLSIDATTHSLLDLVNKTEVICPDCNGNGRNFHRSCAEDEGDWSICKKCHGNGMVRIYIKK